MSGALAADEEFSDCERRNSGWIDQDVNAWSSLGYVAVGLVLLVARSGVVAIASLDRAFAFFVGARGVRAASCTTPRRPMCHRRLHDVPLAAMVAFMAGWHVGRILAPPVESRSARSPSVSRSGALCWQFRRPGRECDRRRERRGHRRCRGVRPPPASAPSHLDDAAPRALLVVALVVLGVRHPARVRSAPPIRGRSPTVCGMC